MHMLMVTWYLSYHDVPDELLRLGVEGLVPGADGDLLGAEEV